jgi:cytochrome c-type biogenesis protein CcmI
MLLNFFIASTVLFLLTLVFVWFYQRRLVVRNAQSLVDLEAQFRERLAALVLAKNAGELAEADFAQAAQELKHQFIPKDNNVAALERSQHETRTPRMVLLLGVVLLTALVYGLTGQYQQLADFDKAQQNLQRYGERALLNQGESLTDDEVSLFALGLRQKLATDGDDATAWYLLGRIYLSQGYIDDAIAAFDKALVMTPERIPVLLSKAQAELTIDGEETLKAAATTLSKVLTLEPTNIDALSMLALIATERGDTNEARAAWQLLLEQLPKDDPRYAAIEQQLGAMDKGQTMSATANNTAPDTASNTASNTAVTSAEPAATAGRQVTITLSIDPALQSAYQDATLFVFAKADAGPPLPLAVKKLTMNAAAAPIVLSEQDAMQAGWSLAQAQKIKVSARLSRSGTVTPSADDVSVESAVLEFTQPALQVSLHMESK